MKETRGSARQKTVLKGHEVPEVSIDPTLPRMKTIIKRSPITRINWRKKLVVIRKVEAKEKNKIKI